MKRIAALCLGLCFLNTPASADTIEKYASIAKSIPSNRLKADPKAQAWAHSARSILNVTEETLAQTIDAIQVIAMRNHQPLFCLPNGQTINNQLVHDILEQAVNQLSRIDPQTTISQVVVEQLEAAYPCQQQVANNSRYTQTQSQPSANNNTMFGRNNFQIQSAHR